MASFDYDVVIVGSGFREGEWLSRDGGARTPPFADWKAGLR
jgi:hypothetical protein